MEPLDRWVERQYRHSASALLLSVSPTHIVKARPGFAQTVVPRKGSIVASPVLGAYDPDPDYFFHWYRDSAIVIDALRLLTEDAAANIDGRGHFADFVEFSRGLRALDGRELLRAPGWRESIAADYRQFVRTEADLGSVQGDAVLSETRVNPNGTIDISNWPRPQNDGPALRALTVLRWLQRVPMETRVLAAAHSLLREDLEFVQRHCRESSFDIWEEEQGFHYYTLRVGAEALIVGAGWLEQQGDSVNAANCHRDAAAAMSLLDGYWRDDAGFYRSRVLQSGEVSRKELDISVILAALHSAGTGATHSVRDPRMHATLARLEALFSADYAINGNLAHGAAPAMGRYAGDVYYSGGAYYFSTLGAAEFCYRAAQRARQHQPLYEHGDAFLETVRKFTPASGDLSEQFDQNTGVQRSARQLAWSHAAFISCATARRAAARAKSS
jgi:glucoamylase